jgi:hypothetical protein
MWPNTRFNQLLTVQSSEIQFPDAGPSGAEESCCVGKGIKKFASDIIADDIAARSDARAHENQEFSGVCPEGVPHRAQRVHANPVK